jgi:hypothetical protein
MHVNNVAIVWGTIRSLMYTYHTLRFFNGNDIRMEGNDRIRSRKGLGGSHGRADRAWGAEIISVRELRTISVGRK